MDTSPLNLPPRRREISDMRSLPLDRPRSEACGVGSSRRRAHPRHPQVDSGIASLETQCRLAPVRPRLHGHPHPIGSPRHTPLTYLPRAHHLVLSPTNPHYLSTLCPSMASNPRPISLPPSSLSHFNPVLHSILRQLLYRVHQDILSASRKGNEALRLGSGRLKMDSTTQTALLRT